MKEGKPMQHCSEIAAYTALVSVKTAGETFAVLPNGKGKTDFRLTA
jgi:hypothetical protein